MGKYYTLAETKNLLGVKTRLTIYNYLKKGIVKGIKKRTNGHWLITKESVDKLIIK